MPVFKICCFKHFYNSRYLLMAFYSTGTLLQLWLYSISSFSLGNLLCWTTKSRWIVSSYSWNKSDIVGLFKRFFQIRFTEGYKWEKEFCVRKKMVSENSEALIWWVKGTTGLSAHHIYHLMRSLENGIPSQTTLGINLITVPFVAIFHSFSLLCFLSLWLKEGPQRREN